MRIVPTVVAKSLKTVLWSRVELRIAAVLPTLAMLALAALGFGAFMKDGAERSTPRGGALGRAAFKVGSLPENLYLRFFRATVYGPAREQRFPGRGGLVFARSSPSLPGMTRRGGEAGYLVVARNVPFAEKDAAEAVSRADSISGHAPLVVEIIDLNRRKIVHAWKPVSDGRLSRFNVLPDGSLLGGSGRVTFRMDACSNVVWERPLRAHHSYERGVDGGIWSPWHVAPNTIPHVNPDFVEDGVIRFSPAGEVLSRVSLSGALMRAGHRHLLYGAAQAGHSGSLLQMNDVEPVLRDGPFWRRGDLFVSLRAVSVVLLYRPATDEVLWLQAGPWQLQHDVDVVSDSEISVYGNNTFVDEDGDDRVWGANEVHVHDFATGETRSPWREAMRRHDVRTRRRGGATVFGDGGVMLEEGNYGRVLTLSPDGEEVWSYVNRASDGKVYEILASRWLDAEYGAGVARSIASLDCGAERD